MKRRLLFWAVMALFMVSSPFVAKFFLGSSFDVQITIPAGHTEGFVYADEEISPMKHTLILRTAEGTPDGEVILKGVEVKEERAYEPVYITAGFPTQIPVERWAWFQIGLNIPNPSEEDLTVTLRVQSAELRIS